MPSASFDETRLAAARLCAVQAQPFLAVALYALTPIADTTRPTFSVDERWRLYVNPDRLTEWSVPEVAGVLLHEVGHLVRDHPGRARTMNVHGDELATLWNFAADAEINDDLVASGIELPNGGGVTPALLGEKAGMVAEYYYTRLRDGKAPPNIDLADCGSGCHGVSSEPAELRHLLAGHAGLSEVEAMLLRKRTAEAVALAIATTGAGSVAGGWARWAEALLRPQLDWRTLLGAAVRSAVAAVRGNADYSYQRPSRRRVPRVVLPAMQRPVPRVAIVIDTSGSVDDDQLAVAWSEVHGCLRRLGTRRDLLSVYAADVDLHKLRGTPSGRVELLGGGGTDMGAAVTTVLKTAPKPDLLVVITDGFTPWPEKRPLRPVIVVLLPTEWGTPEPPPAWAKVIALPAGRPTRWVTAQHQ
ncbi:MAG TPA: VWA-like domain-containing protein [Acidothermaceae bacterium]|jgi:predicted metal-dependent peptidase|nr:VWA-like domain-containing protein [Acidothermaceae bacterium]